jgi:hypothetical protein
MDQPGEAEKFSRAASRLKPRDAVTTALMWDQRIAMVRHGTRKRQFELARRELAAAAETAPPDVEPGWLEVIRAAIEYKAQNDAEAEQHLGAAITQADEPTSIWLMMHATAVRYGLNREAKNDFRDRFKSAVGGGCTSQTAGRMARFLLDFVRKQTKYSGLATHQRLVMDYLRRAEGIDWQERDLRSACELLLRGHTWKLRSLSLELAEYGTRHFPQNPFFPLVVALMEMEEGPFMMDVPYAMGMLREALSRNQRAEIPLSAEYLAMAKKSMATLDAVMHMGPYFMDDDDDEDAEFGYFDDEDEDEDEDDAYDEDDDSYCDSVPEIPDDLDEATLREMLPSPILAVLEAYAVEVELSLLDVMRGIVCGEIDMAEVARVGHARAMGSTASRRSRRAGRKSSTRP